MHFRSQTQRPSVAKSLGFTLVEIMVVVVILGILAAALVPRLVNQTDNARAVAAKQDIATLMQALKLYRIDNSRYPTTEQGLRSLYEKPTVEPVPTNWKKYIEKVPKDPWGFEYKYLSPGVKGEIDVFTLGLDNKPGGTDANADIGNWDL